MGLCLASKGDPNQTDDMPAPTSTYENIEEQTTERIYFNDEQLDSKNVRLADFQFDKVLGRGSFGKVMLVTYKPTKELYAMKVLRKEMVEKRNQRLHTQNERSILENVSHPFIVQLHFAFQTKLKLYLIMDFMIGGTICIMTQVSYSFT